MLFTKLKQKIPALGTHISLNDSAITELIGNLGFDYLWIDMEHTAIDLYCLQQHLIAARAARVSAIVRIPWNDPVRAKPVLDMGPDGIVFPMVNSYEEAKKAVESCMYPPKGNRGFGPRRAIEFGNIDIQNYLACVDQLLLKFIQIEHIDAVRDLDRILTIEEIDGLVIGPRDLAASMGKIGAWDDPEVLTTIQSVINKVHAAGKPVGLSSGFCAYQDIQRWRDRGVDMLSIAADTDLLLLGAKDLLAQMREIFADRLL
ncbi:MAG TPA: aldolase [Firmicutes bacterium]|jgi:4-hydroxy-2-oxoheptanedioate aldolase|nr:aldolase [Bacillota bacterium]